MLKKKLNIWIFQKAEKNILDKRNRLWRSSLIANEAFKRGHTIKIWTSSFDHYSKKHRFINNRLIAVKKN